MTNNVVVTYSIKPETLGEHVRLIEGVFEQLRADHVREVEYRVLGLADGVSFVHVATTHTADGSNPLPELAAFREFTRDLSSRVTGPPNSGAARVVGSHSLL